MHQLLNMIAFMTARINVARDEAKDRGATATEYALLVGFIALVLVAGVGFFGGKLDDWFHALGDTVSGWTGGSSGGTS